MEHLYNLVRKTRKEQGLTQSQMAKSLGLSPRSYQRKEAGAFTLDEFVRACRVLGLRLAVLSNDNLL